MASRALRGRRRHRAGKPPAEFSLASDPREELIHMVNLRPQRAAGRVSEKDYVNRTFRLVGGPWPLRPKETQRSQNRAGWDSGALALPVKPSTEPPVLGQPHPNSANCTATALIPEGARAGAHLRVGRVLLASMTADLLAEHLFDAANQLNRGAERLIDGDEKVPWPRSICVPAERRSD